MPINFEITTGLHWYSATVPTDGLKAMHEWEDIYTYFQTKMAVTFNTIILQTPTGLLKILEIVSSFLLPCSRSEVSWLKSFPHGMLNLILIHVLLFFFVRNWHEAAKTAFFVREVYRNNLYTAKFCYFFMFISIIYRFICTGTCFTNSYLYVHVLHSCSGIICTDSCFPVFSYWLRVYTLFNKM
jgi:hypothetical protein